MPKAAAGRIRIAVGKICMAVALAAGLAMPGGAQAETVTVAVAANFTKVAEALAPLFKAETGHDVRYSFGSTGQLYTQIAQGAPFEVLLAADTERPARAIEEGLAVAGTAFAYAVGALALYSTSISLDDGGAVLEGGVFDKIAIADPETAPYGRAAVQAIDALGLTEALAGKLVTGQNISQTLQFVDSGNAEVGFVAASQVSGRAGVWLVPPGLYSPIEQDGVLLNLGASNPAAMAFLAFLRSGAAVAMIEAAGYRVE
ncbi:MAG: molybdate ABC transporter substrate-binding protein [Devosia sp.]